MGWMRKIDCGMFRSQPGGLSISLYTIVGCDLGHRGGGDCLSTDCRRAGRRAARRESETMARGGLGCGKARPKRPVFCSSKKKIERGVR